MKNCNRYRTLERELDLLLVISLSNLKCAKQPTFVGDCKDNMQTSGAIVRSLYLQNTMEGCRIRKTVTAFLKFTQTVNNSMPWILIYMKENLGEKFFFTSSVFVLEEFISSVFICSDEKDQIMRVVFFTK